MIEQHAIILALEANHNATHTLATLEIERQTACGLCGQTRGCGNSIWGKLFAHRTATFRATNAIDAKVGDRVIVGIQESALLKSAFLLYMLPLATLIFGAILASKLHDSNGSAMLGAVIGLLLGFIWVKGHTMSSSYVSEQQPVILRTANKNEVIFN